MKINETWNSFSKLNSKDYEYICNLSIGCEKTAIPSVYISKPKNALNHPVLIWFHGGGLTDDSREIQSSLFDGYMLVVEVRYRISPEFRADTAIEDAATAIGWTFRNIEKYGGNKNKIFIGGMSAGSYLAAITSMNPEFAERHQYSSMHPAGLLLISGQMTTHFRVKEDLHYPQGQFIPVIDKLAPLAHLRADLPPILLVTGESGLDMPARPEENAFMAASLKALGHKDVEFHALSGHDHGASLTGSAFLMEQFIKRLLAL